MRTFLIALALLVSGLAFAQKDKKITEKTVDKSYIATHLKFLSSDALRGRDTPSQGLEVAAEYIKTQLELYGVKAFPEYPDYLQPVSMKKIRKPGEGLIRTDTTVFALEEDFLLLSGGNINWSGEYVFLPNANPDELEKADVNGKIVVAGIGDGVEQSPRAWFRMSGEKRARVKEAGGVALIELYNSQQIPWRLLVRYLGGERITLDKGEEEDDFVSIWMNDIDRAGSKAFKASGELEVNFSGAGVERFEVSNVVGYVEGTDASLKDEYVAYTAHYDHVGVGRPDSTGDDIYNGTRDNAVGTVTVLEAAKNLAKYPTKRSSLFVLFAGEEKGLLGSEWYVENSPVALKDIVFCFNSDNGGYNDTSIATIIGLDRTTAQEHMVEALETFGLTAKDDENFKEQNLFDRSDNVNFARAGIPAPCFSMGVTAFDQQVLSTYHQPSDEFETIDMDYLFKFYRAYVLAGRKIANSKEAPFWVEGDKYYDAGKELYK